MSIKKHGGYAYATDIWVGPKSVNARYTAAEAAKLVEAVNKLLDLGYPEIDIAHYITAQKTRLSDGAKQVTVNSSSDPQPYMVFKGPGLHIDLVGVKGYQYLVTYEVGMLEMFLNHIRVELLGLGHREFQFADRREHDGTLVFLASDGALIRLYGEAATRIAA